MGNPFGTTTLTMVFTLPMLSKVKSQPPPNLSWKYCWIGLSSLVGSMNSVQPNFLPANNVVHVIVCCSDRHADDALRPQTHRAPPWRRTRRCR